MGAPIKDSEMRGAAVYTFEYPGGHEDVGVRPWYFQSKVAPFTRYGGWVAFRRTPEGIQMAYAGRHPGDIPRSMWQTWYGAHSLEFWTAARRELKITHHPAGAAQ